MISGLNYRDSEQVRQIFTQIPAVRRVILYGSRAMNTHRSGSDIDLAIEADSLTFTGLLGIIRKLDDLGFLYTFDVKDIRQIKNPELLAHIERVGKTLYERT